MTLRPALALLVLLSGCAGPYRVQSATESEFSACYDHNLQSRQVVAEAAARHCAARGLAARPAMNGSCGMMGGSTSAVFECVGRPAAS